MFNQVIPGIFCPECKAAVALKRTWQQALVVCRSCGKEFAMEQFSDRIDDAIEEMLARIPCNRL